MEMREYRPEDLEAVKRIANAAWRPIISMGRKELGDRIADLRRPDGDDCSKGNEVERQLKSGLYEILICADEDRVVGFITYRINGCMGEFCNNAALPDSGLKGIGQCMYHAVLDKMRQAGVKVVSVSTGLDDAHAAARRAYERAGFDKFLDSRTYYMSLE